jgi:hypothetical protein
MKDKYEGVDKNILEKIKNIPSPSLKLKLIEINSITNILLYDKEDKFHNDYKSVRGKYEKDSFDIYKKISDIINGKKDPTEYLSEEDYQHYSMKKDTELTKINNYKEINDFWLTALKNSDYFDISKKEEKILHYLKDIQIELHENNIDFTIKYIFNENEYFQNEIIKKHYFYQLSNEKLERTEFDDIKWNKKNNANNNNKKNNKNKKNFFDMFDKEKITKELDENEANFMKNDFMPGILGYYLDLVVHDSDSEENKIETFSIGKVNIKTIK